MKYQNILNIIKLIILLFLYSCVETPDKKISDFNVKGDLLVLSEGLIGQDNSKLQLINLDSNKNNLNYFEQINMLKLGDTANDMILVDDYIYIIISHTNKIIKLNKNTGIIEKSHLFEKNRFIKRIHYNNFLYISDLLNNTVIKLSPDNLEIISEINVGPGPEGLVSSNNILFVANSAVGQIKDKEEGARTISVIDLNQDIEINKIYCGPNTMNLEIANNKLYASYVNFHWSDSIGAIVEYDLISLNKIAEYKTEIHSKIKYYDNKIYFINKNGLNYLELNENIFYNKIQNNSSNIWYSFDIKDNNYYILNSFNHQIPGELIIFNSDDIINKYITGINPNSILFFY
jgi:hypothetical protein